MKCPSCGRTKGKVYRCSNISCREIRCSHIECTGGNGKKGKAISEGTCKKCGKGRYNKEYTISNFERDERERQEIQRAKQENIKHRDEYNKKVEQEKTIQAQASKQNIENKKPEEEQSTIEQKSSKKNYLRNIVLIVILAIIVKFIEYLFSR